MFIVVDLPPPLSLSHTHTDTLTHTHTHPSGASLRLFDMVFLNLTMSDKLLISVILLNDGTTLSIISYDVTDAQFIINKCKFCKSFLFKHLQFVQ